MRFLLSNERAYVGASNLFSYLDKLGVNTTLFALPIPYIMSSEELSYWLDCLDNELRSLGNPNQPYLDYVKQVSRALRKWADAGHVIHIM